MLAETFWFGFYLSEIEIALMLSFWLILLIQHFLLFQPVSLNINNSKFGTQETAQWVFFYDKGCRILQLPLIYHGRIYRKIRIKDPLPPK